MLVEYLLGIAPIAVHHQMNASFITINIFWKYTTSIVSFTILDNYFRLYFSFLKFIFHCFGNSNLLYINNMPDLIYRLIIL